MSRLGISAAGMPFWHLIFSVVFGCRFLVSPAASPSRRPVSKGIFS